jgi:hypothetical protein
MPRTPPSLLMQYGGILVRTPQNASMSSRGRDLGKLIVGEMGRLRGILAQQAKELEELRSSAFLITTNV